MNKSKINSNIARRFNYLNTEDVDQAINSILELISSSLYNRDRVEIRGFGTFSCRKRSARMGRNPNTGQAITIGTKFHPYFRASKALKASLNK